MHGIEKPLQGNMISVKVKKNIIHIKCKVKASLGDTYAFQELRLLYRVGKEEQEQEQKQEFSFPLTICKKTKNDITFRSAINLNEVELKPIYWDFQLVAAKGDQSVSIELKNRSYLTYAKDCLLFFENKYEYGDGMFVYPYVSSIRGIALQYRKKTQYDDYRLKLKERLAVLRFILTYPWLRHKKIFLVYEKFCDMAQDNGFYFFKYCMEHHMEKQLNRSIFYVIDKHAADRGRLEPYQKNVIDFMSTRHLAYGLAARLLISSESKTHIYAKTKGSALAPFIKRKKAVFLQHGVTGLKKVPTFQKGKSGSSNLFIVCSEFEKNIVKHHLGYKDEEIAVTGFARWDVLKDGQNENREILIMPTWRSWLEHTSDETFKKSSYYRNYMELLQSEQLKELLVKHDLELTFYIHPKFKEYMKNFVVTNEERIHLTPFGQEPLNGIMMRCKMLITDYSSVSWDVLYMKKPVVFFQFDYDGYMSQSGSYMDLKTQLLGERVERVGSLLQVIEQYADNGFALREEYEKKQHDYFKYIDQDNSKRICEAIVQRGF
ncbi:CDP-glycerol glycerophosphotransferase family protein [Lachnospiraceae bacterium ZAX-1]